MVQVPTASPVTVLPLTVQMPGVVVLNVTGLPDAPPVALTVVVPPTLKDAGLKLIAPMLWLA